MGKAKLTRYYARGGKKAADMWPHRSGDWVHHDEAAAALAEAQKTIARLEAALRIARGHVAHSIEEWGVDDETSAAMKEDLRVIESALSPGKAEGE